MNPRSSDPLPSRANPDPWQFRAIQVLSVTALSAFAMYVFANKFDQEWYVVLIILIVASGGEGAKEIFKRWR